MIDHVSEVEFFRDTLVEFGRVTQALWTLNLTVTLAAVGWGVTSRSWQRGLHPLVCIAATGVLTAFYVFNVHSLNTFYLRANAAAQELRRAYSEAGLRGDVASMFADAGTTVQTQLGPVVVFLVAVLICEFVVAIAIGVLLSAAGRRPPA